MTTVILDQNGIKTDKEIDFSSLKTVTDILKELNINEETVLIFFKEVPIPFDEKIDDIGPENIHDGDFRILKVIFDG
jgi:sulfur carrier protein ThiS